MAHVEGGERVIPFSPGGIALTGSDLLGRERFPSRRLLGLPLAILLTAACASSTPPLVPTETPPPARPTVTPIPIGGVDSSACDPQGIVFGTDGKPSPSLTEKIIEEFNACVLAQKAAAEATATAETQEKMIPEVVALIGEPTGYRPATNEEVNLFTEQIWAKGTPNEQKGVAIPRPGTKFDSRGNLSIPRYSPGTILGELETIQAKNYYPEEVATGRQQEIYRWMGQIEQATQEVHSRNFKKAEELLNVTTWDGIEKASRGDKYSFKIGRLPNDPDQNGNGISDLLEPAYNLIKKALIYLT